MKEKHQQKRKTSVFYQFLEGGSKQEDKRPGSKNYTNMNIFKNMADVLKKEQLNDKDSHIYNVDNWMQIIKQMIKERDLLCKIQPDKFIVEVLFAELSLFENTQMLQFALSLLNRIYGQRRELIQNFEKILIVATGFTFTLSVESRVTRTKLLGLNDRNILQASLENQKDYNVYIWRESQNPKESGIIQDLQWLVQCLKRKEETTRPIVAYDSLFPKNSLKEVYTEKDLNHKLH